MSQLVPDVLLIIRESLKKGDKRQSSYDANNDGVITREELNDGHMSRTAWQGPAWGQDGISAVPEDALECKASVLKMTDERLAICLRVALGKHTTLQQKESFSQGQLDEAAKALGELCGLLSTADTQLVDANQDGNISPEEAMTALEDPAVSITLNRTSINILTWCFTEYEGTCQYCEATSCWWAC